MTWRVDPDVMWLEVDAAVIAFQRASREFIELDGSAADLWRELVWSGWSHNAAVDFIVSTSSTNRAEGEAIVGQFCSDLAAKRVIVADL